MDLTDAIQIACQAHAGQTDKGGEPYILHPLRVMLAMDTEQERIVAVLHDVFEDAKGRVSVEDFLSISHDCRDALELLTRNESETYTEYIESVAQNRLATRVKLADLEDNLSADRIHNIDKSQRIRYESAWSRLTGAMEQWT